MVAETFHNLHIGDTLPMLRRLPDESVHCCVTSPPYWGLRDYDTESTVWENEVTKCSQHEWVISKTVSQGGGGSAKQRSNVAPTFDTMEQSTCSICGAWRGSLGLEPTPKLFVQHLVEIFREVKRVLRDDGTCWLNLGDSYSGDKTGGRNDTDRKYPGNPDGLRSGAKLNIQSGLKPKDLVGIPWRVAFALQEDGWYLRSDIIWHKPNAMPESVTDRPTKSHEYIFLLTKKPTYYYDIDAIREPYSPDGRQATTIPVGEMGHPNHKGRNGHERWANSGRNKRTVWTMPTQPFPDAHSAIP